MKAAKAIIDAGRGQKALQAYQATVAEFPGTPEAAKANADLLIAKMGKR